MKKVFWISGLPLILALGMAAQGRGREHGGALPPPSQGRTHSNAPAGTPAASSDRDFGRERAEDVGRGKKKGLKKPRHENKSKHDHDRDRGR